MVQTERETGALRGQFARQAAVQVSAAAQAESARAQAEQLSRKLAAARAEVRRYQTRMFAFERTLLPSSTRMQSWKPPVSRHGSSWNRPMPGQNRLRLPAAERKLLLLPCSRLPRKHLRSRIQPPRPCRNARLHRNSLYRRRKKLSVPRNRRCPRSPHSLHGSRRPGWSRWLRS